MLNKTSGLNDFLNILDTKMTKTRKITFEELKVGIQVQDSDSIKGIVSDIKDIHNVYVLYGKGGVSGSGLYCLDKNCNDYDPLFQIQKK